jgi:hypothetical protein
MLPEPTLPSVPSINPEIFEKALGLSQHDGLGEAQYGSSRIWFDPGAPIPSSVVSEPVVTE